MVLDRHEEEEDAVEELDPVDRGHAHVEEDAEENGRGDELEDGGQGHRQAEQHGDHGEGQALV